MLAPLLSSPELSTAQFRRVAKLTYTVAGINLGTGKEGLVRSRLTKRLRELDLPGFDPYLDLVERGSEAGKRELAQMIDALTTNKTSFFREPAHFEFMRQRMLPELGTGREPIRIWSAGCSTGEEPYTIGMVLRDAAAGGATRDARILATDISPRVVAQARAASYTDVQVADVPPDARRWLTPAAGRWQVSDAVRSLVSFAHLNLMGEWPMQGPFDAIFCRNVMIYFDKPTQARLVDRFHALLRPGGYLFVGHSESLSGLDHRFQYVQPAVYVS